MKPSDEQIKEAQQILSLYERSLVEKMAEEIVENRESFESPFVGNAEQMVDKYSHLLYCLCRIRSSLGAHAPRHKPPSVQNEPLDKDEFRCFRCRSIIKADADACPECGWTWG